MRDIFLYIVPSLVQKNWVICFLSLDWVSCVWLDIYCVGVEEVILHMCLTDLTSLQIIW